MTRPLTDKTIAKLKPPASGRADHFDAEVPGLHLRISATGHKTWRYFYRRQPDGAQRVLTIGPGLLPLKEARLAAKRAAVAVAAGQDPAAAKQAARKAAKDAASVEALVERFLAEAVRPRLRRADEVERIFEKEVLPAWGRRKARDVTRADVKALLAPIATRAPVMANRVRAAVSRFFNWAVDADCLGASPATRVKAPGEEHERQRVLTAAEIRALWTAADALDPRGLPVVSPFMAAFFRLRLVTAQRGGEVPALRWAEIEGEWWTIPPARAKNGLAHRVPLSLQARAILDGLPRVVDSPYVFPGRKAGQPIVAYQKAWQTLCEAAKLEDVVSHDLRRTAASGMASLGVPRLVIAKVLNHVEPGITRVYDRHSYDAEKKDALERWGRQVDAILSGTKGQAEVIPLHAPRADTAEAGR